MSPKNGDRSDSVTPLRSSKLSKSGLGKSGRNKKAPDSPENSSDNGRGADKTAFGKDSA